MSLPGLPYGSMLYVYNGRWEAIVEAFCPIGLVVEPGRIAQQQGETPLFDGASSKHDPRGGEL